MTGPLNPIYKKAEDCPYASERHTPSPPGYVAWHHWAAKMQRSHRQVKCTHCGFYAVWKEK